jgi:NADH dehydrogenase
MAALPRVVVVGGGFGGLAAARSLRRVPAEVLLADRQNHHLFQPLLYQVATAALSPGNIAAPIRRILARQRNCQVVMAEVTDVDLARRTVALAGTEYAFDYVVLAAGAVTNYFGRDDWAAQAPGLKTVEEAIAVRARFLLAFEQAEIETDPAARRRALTFTIVGAGPTGVELAGAIAEISRHTLRRDFRHFDTESVRVVLIDMAERVLPGFAPRLSARAARDLASMGVEILTQTRVVGADDAGLTVERDGRSRRIDAGTVVWAAGVCGAPLAARLGVPLDSSGRVVVAGDLSVPGHPEAFVVGDLAHRIDPRTGRPVPGVAQGAMQMGRHAGRTIAAEIKAAACGRPAPPRRPFVYRDKGALATIGRNRAVAEIRGLRFGGRVAFLVWAFVHIWFLIDFRRRVLAMLEWIWMYFFYERGVRLITGRGAIPRPVRPPPDPRLEARRLESPSGASAQEPASTDSRAAPARSQATRRAP